MHARQLLHLCEVCITPCRYVFSYGVAQSLHALNQVSPLKLMPNEDATFGFWWGDSAFAQEKLPVPSLTSFSEQGKGIMSATHVCAKLQAATGICTCILSDLVLSALAG